MARAYLRLDPAFFEKKVLGQGYPAAAAIALVGVLCLAEHQPERGRFRNERVLRVLLEDYAKQVPYLFAKGDLVRLDDGRIYPPGWDEWQEGDWKVGERVRRIRARRGGVTPTTVAHVTVPTVTPDTVAVESKDSVPTVYTPSDGRRQSVIDGGGGKRSGTESLHEEDSSSATNGRARKTERADIQALLDRGWRRVTKAQRAVLAEVLARHDVTGPEFAAEVIRSTPPDADPLAAVMEADRRWQSAQRRRADADEAESAEKPHDRTEGLDTRVAAWMREPAEAKA